MTRLKAFATHFGISALIFAIILYFLLMQWYPFPFFSTDGGWQGIRIVAFVNIVLGPCLTFVVYKPGKKLKLIWFDLTVIGIIQTAALSWGIYTVYQLRPAAAVFVEDYFTTVAWHDMEQHLTPAELKATYGHDPATIYLNVPKQDLQAARLTALRSGVSMAMFKNYYARIDASTIPAILAHAFDLAAYVADKPADKKIYDSFTAKHRDEMDRLAFLEWHGRSRWGYLAVRKDTLAFIDFLAIDPLPVTRKKIK